MERATQSEGQAVRRTLATVIKEHGYLIPVAAVLGAAAVWPVILSHKEPLVSRRQDVLRYVEGHDHLHAIILGHGTYAEGGTAWIVQPAGKPYESFVMVDDGFFRTHVSYDGYYDMLTKP